MEKPTKAESLLAAISNLVPGKSIMWPVYDGKDLLEAKTVQDYVEIFFRTGNLMPVHVVPNLGLNILSVQTEYDDQNHHHRIILEGIVTILKKENENE